jgi:murein DD-endopeptidase MepM/ murein hydrolase activator NlpD
MMIFNRRFSILLIPHNKGKIFEVKLSSKALGLLVLGFVLLLSSSLFLFLSASGRAYEKLKLSRLAKENSYLMGKQNELNSAISDLKGQMAELIEKEKEVRLVFGLPQVDEQVRRLGVGGPSPGAPVKIGAELEQLSLTELEVDQLLRQARFEKENFDEIYSSLQDRKTALDHTPSIRPSAGYLSCSFGMRIDPFTGRREFHRGVDLAA